jgi:hypothetical protein
MVAISNQLIGYLKAIYQLNPYIKIPLKGSKIIRNEKNKFVMLFPHGHRTITGLVTF